MKKRVELVYVDVNNYNQIINKYYTNNRCKVLMYSVITSKNFHEKMDLLTKIKKSTPKFSDKDFIKNFIIITDKDYLPNDLGVQGVLTVSNLNEFDFNSFSCDFENKINLFKTTDDFFASIEKKYNFKYTQYSDDFWLYSINNMGILTINDETYLPIMKNYHRVKFLTSDIIFISLSGDCNNSDKNKFSLLKMIGSDALITFGVTNNHDLKFSQQIDLILYYNNRNFEKIGKSFFNSFMYTENFAKDKKTLFNKLRDFFAIEEKSFEPDLFDEVPEESKDPKKYAITKIRSCNYNDKIEKEKIEKEKITLFSKDRFYKNHWFILEKIEYN